MKKLFFIFALFASALTVACNDNILEEVESYVVLSPDNTYLTGDEVRFDLRGIADYVYFYSGEVGSKYIYKDRTTIAMEDLETCKLVIEYMAHYGTVPGMLDVYVSNSFPGLSGIDAQSDLATVEDFTASMDSGKNIPGWEKLLYNEGGSGVTTTQEYDLMDYTDHFCLAFHWNPPSHEILQRTYRLNVYLQTKFRGYDEVTTRGADLGLITVSKNFPDNPYHKNGGNGTVIYTNKDHEILMQGAGAGVLPYTIDSWVVTTPRPLNNVAPDKGMNVKSMADNIEQYAYAYAQPGTYTASFVMTNGNYQGLNRKVQDVTFTIIDPIGVPVEPIEVPAEPTGGR